ncbi:MAG: DUF4785 domain-containing protein [Acidobacteriota bacterium]
MHQHNDRKAGAAPGLITAALLLVGLAGSALAQEQLQALGASDFAAAELVRLPAEKGLMPGVSRDAVDFSYALDSSYAHNGELSLGAAPSAFEAQSREYFVDVDAAALAEGVTIYTTAPGALVRIHPRSDNKASTTVDPAGLTVSLGGVTYGASEGFDRLVSVEQLKATGVPFAEGTAAFRLSPAVGPGAITLSAPAFKSQGVYTVHVFDQASSIALKLGAERGDYLHGDSLRVEASFGGASVALGEVEGFVTSPGGRAWPLALTVDRDRVRGTLALDAAVSPGQGLWEVHLAVRGASGGLDVVRSVRTAFAAHLPTAKLSGEVERLRGAGLALSFGVDVGTPGRYEVRGVLYGTDAAGDLAPMALGHAADWLDASGDLVLRFPVTKGFRAPFEVRDLRLLDQGRMGVLHRQAVALRIGR